VTKESASVRDQFGAVVDQFADQFAVAVLRLPSQIDWKPELTFAYLSQPFDSCKMQYLVVFLS